MTNKAKFIKVFTKLNDYLERTNQTLFMDNSQDDGHYKTTPTFIMAVEVTKNFFKFFPHNRQIMYNENPKDLGGIYDKYYDTLNKINTLYIGNLRAYQLEGKNNGIHFILIELQIMLNSEFKSNILKSL